MQHIDTEISRIEANIKKCNANLNNIAFINNAPGNIIALEQNKKKDFESQLIALKNSLKTKQNKYSTIVESSIFTIISVCGISIEKYLFLIRKLKNIDGINNHIQYLRESTTSIKKYTKEWFDFIYDKDIKDDELNSLCNIFNKFV